MKKEGYMSFEFTITDSQALNLLCGVNDKNFLVFKSHFGFDVTLNGNKIVTNAPAQYQQLLEKIFQTLVELANHKVILTERDIIYIIKLAQDNSLEGLLDLYKTNTKILVTDQGKVITPKTFNQKAYVNALMKYPLVLGVGPAGTGKTYLAVALAVSHLKAGKVKKLILTRPAVEAGESLGFLPGDLKEKVDPYLIPLYDALNEMLGSQTTQNLLEKGVIEIAPLAYMRGRTLENAYVILDEAQNTTITQMKMFLTRLGFSSKMVVTGDPSQVDLQRGVKSGLIDAVKRLKKLDEAKIIEFEKIDVIRHPLVQKILESYETHED